MTGIETKAAVYASYFERVAPGNLGELRDLCAVDVHFRDPFNDVRGQDQIVRIFAKMFEDLDEPKFEVVDNASSGSNSYMRWVMRFKSKKNGKSFLIEGMTEVHFDQFGKVVAHLDHWDAASQLYEHVPLLGGVLRIIRRRLAL